MVSILLFNWPTVFAYQNQEETGLETKAREALVNYVKNVILDKNNPEGEAVRRTVLDHRSLEDREEAEHQMLVQAEAFPELSSESNQSQPWILEKSDNPDRPYFYFFGQISGLAAEIRFDDAGKEVINIFIEVD